MPRCLACGRRANRVHSVCCSAPQLARQDEATAAFIDVVPDLRGYDIGRLLGRGGNGAVFAARRTADGLHVAVKVARHRGGMSHARMAHETRALVAVGPPAVPEWYEGGVLDDGRPYVVIELLTGRSLADDLAERNGPLALAEFASCARGILDAVEHVHRARLVHRDLKPENVFICPSGRARLIDFGITHADPDDSACVLTGPGDVLGTAVYMSPEQAASQPVDARSDVYALGVLFYELLTLRVPFFGLPADVRQAHRERRPPPPSQLQSMPAVVEDVVMRCLNKRPEARFADVAALRAALVDATDQSAATSHRRASPRATLHEGRARRTVALLFAEIDDFAGARALVSQLGGQIPLVAGRRLVALFAHDQAEHPVERAIEAARRIVASRLADRLMISLERLSFQRRPDGSEQVLGPRWTHEDVWSLVGADAGIRLTRPAAQSVPHACTRAEARQNGLLELAPSDAAETDLPAPVVRAPPLIGRDAELDRLTAAATRATRDGVPTVALLSAGRGLGKSHLCAAFVAATAASRASRTLAIRLEEPMGGDSRRNLRTLVTRLLGIGDDATADAARALLARLVGSVAAEEGEWPVLASAMGWAGSDHPQVRALIAAPNALRAATARTIAQLIRANAAERPIVLAVDDAHFADPMLLDAFELASFAGTGAPLCIALFARPELLASRPLMGERAAARTVVEMSPLSSADAEALCRHLLEPAINVPATVVRALVERTRGTPVLLSELIRGLKSDGLVRKQPVGESWYVASDEIERLSSIPIIEWIAERELARLSPELAAHLRLCAIIGSEFEVAEIEGVLAGLERSGLGAAFPLSGDIGVRQLIDVGVIVSDGTARARFRQPMVRDAILAALPPALKTRIHETAFAYYQQSTALLARERLTRLALHGAASGRVDVSAATYLTLADESCDRHDYVEAETLYSRVLELLPSGSDVRRQRAALGRASSRLRLSRFADALDDLDVAERMAAERGDAHGRASALLDRATLLDWIENFTAARAAVDEAAALVESLPRDPLLQLRVRLGEGRALVRCGRWQAAADVLREVVECGERLGDAAYETTIIAVILLIYLLGFLDCVDAGEQAAERAIARTVEHRDRFHWTCVLLNRRPLWIARGDVGRAKEDLEEVIRVSREDGFASQEMVAQLNLAELVYQCDPESAAAEVETAVALERRRLGEAAHPFCLLLKARLFAHLGHPETRSVLDELRRTQTRAHEPGFQSAALAANEQVLFNMVDLLTRPSSADEWDELVRRSAQCSLEQEPIEILEARAIWAERRGELAEAQRWLGLALEAAARRPNVMMPRLRRRGERLTTLALPRVRPVRVSLIT